MNTTIEKHEQFSQEKIMESEPRFIDIYSNQSLRTKPLKLLLKMYKGHYVKLLLSGILYIIKASPIWILPIISTNVINIAIDRPPDAVKKLIINFIIVFVVLAQNIPFHMLHIKFFSVANRSVEAGLRGAMIRKLQQLSITFHKEMASGKIQSKIMRDVEAISEFATHLYGQALNIAVNMSISLAVVLSKNITVFLMFLVCVPMSVLIRQRFIKPMRRQSRAFRKEIENTASAIYDMEELIPVTRAHALENKEVKKMTAEVANIAERGYNLDMIQSLFGSVNWVAFNLMQIICLFFSSVLAMKGRITIGEITLYQTYFNLLTGYVSSIINLLPIISKGTESIHSVGEILAAYDIEDNRNKPKLSVLNGRYEFKNVSFSYDERTPVLSNFSMTVEPGETIALVGESGSGKSTIINLILGFVKPNSGELLVDGRNIYNIDLHSYRSKLSIVPQESILFSGTIRENITYGLKNISEERLNKVVKAACLDSVIEKLPDGLDTYVGEHGAKLSGGQRQRISIARAIIRDPKVIIFDEATSALDSVTEREIQSAIENLTVNRTTFIVAHRLSTIKNADKIAVLKNGRCVEFGTYDQLLAQKGEFWRYKEMQS